MRQATTQRAYSSYDYAVMPIYEQNSTINCDWPSLRAQLLEQWDLLSRSDLDKIGRDRHEIAVLVQRKYGISVRLVESYLSNLERTLPTLS